MVRDDIGPEPERYYDWMLWKLRQSEKWQEAINYSKQKRKEEVEKKFPPTNGLMLDLKEMTKCYYDVLKRNKELIEENEKLKEENANLHNKK